MKVLFSADWHIKLGQKNVPREWQKNRYKKLFEKLHDLENKAKIHIIGGDIFDNVPKPEEVALFFEFIAGCKIPTYIYDGNHEATRKGKTFLSFFKEAVNNINNNTHVLDGPCTIWNGSIDIIPYTHIKNFKPEDFTADICCTHVRGNIPPHVVEEVDLNLFSRWKTVLAGDLHAHSNSQRNIVYPGSPVSITFHRNKISNGVIIFDTDSHKYELIDLKLPQLIRKTISSKEEVVKDDYDHVIYEITGNISELSDLDSTSDLIDKKIIEKENESVLNLSNLTIEEELEEYLSTVLNLSNSEVQNTIKVFNDYYKKFEME